MMIRCLAGALAAPLVGALVVSACVTSGTHEVVLKELAETRAAKEKFEKRAAAREAELSENWKICKRDLDECQAQNEQFANALRRLGEDANKFKGEAGRLAQQRADLQVQLDRLKELSEKREREYRDVMSRLQKMIDAGTLKVRIRKGLMVIELSNDILFAPGRTDLKDEGKKALTELAATIREIRDRKFQVVGHTDDTPIRTARFPSNWELSTQRAIEVVKLMIEQGVDATLISAAGQAEFDPVAPNDTRDNKALNRRVEIIFVPKVDEMPGFSDAFKQPPAQKKPEAGGRIQDDL